MISLTKTERKALLVLFKDFTNLYNANSISRVLGISHVGAQKLFKRLKDDDLLVCRAIGKAIVCTLNLNNGYVPSLISFLLADEANNHKRWKEEFKGIFKEGRVVIIFGSALRNYKAAKDIDIMVILGQSEEKEVTALLGDKQGVLPKKLHSLLLTKEDFRNNINDKEKAMIDIVKTGIVLYGQDQYVGLLRDVSSE